ncbi:MAG: bifunctional glutamate N-acetyltransferase/amino-acid acetyltransferase ArgJ [Dehalococcoidales bacterium]|nr:bifunctional glutamate N-acetyltransferase/amino-acid acetyltransferase ArgJ [Dehalococcoidales bacterium]
MKETISYIPSGGVTSPKGFCAGAVAAGIKKRMPGLLDLAVLSAGEPVAAAALFTTNRVKAAPVIVSQQRAAGGRVSAVIVNSGCANASAGEGQIADAEAMSALAAARFGLDPSTVLVSSTGIIGQKLPMERISDGVAQLEITEDGGADFARAIMTTDTVPKEVAVTAGGFTIGGCAKGSGMIHPDMATMLVFLTTDAPVEPGFLKQALKKATDISFHMLSIDTDTSTNDMVLLMAGGKSGGELISAGSERAGGFQQALDAACIHLAKGMARDGEGATRRIEVVVRGAASEADARIAARTIVASPLVKATVHGADPNWGRILAAAGRSGAELEPEKCYMEIGGICLLKGGAPVPFERKEVSDYLRSDEVVIVVDLNLGDHEATAWGCDLSREYVTINADYTT